MTSIYSNATRVIVWLGKAEDDTHWLFRGTQDYADLFEEFTGVRALDWVGPYGLNFQPEDVWKLH